jgi:hypothetical protein
VRALAWVRAKLDDPRAQFAVGAGLVTLGLDLLVRNIGGRLELLESRGWTPMDDVATVGDLEQLRADVVPGPDGTAAEEAGP